MLNKKNKIKHFFNLEDVSAKLQISVGVKAALLGQVKKKKINVPEGFIISASVFEEFLSSNGLISEIEQTLQGVNINSLHTIEKASEKIIDLIRDGKFPYDLSKEIMDQFRSLKTAKVIVRPSVSMTETEIASWAGELEYYSNVVEKILIERIKQCWSSLFSPAALFYRFGRNLADENISISVIVQRMLISDISGICYTQHPVTAASDQIVIEAGFGLGAGVIRNKIDPDTYVVKKDRKKTIVDKRVLNQHVMVVPSSIGVKSIRVPEARRERQKLSDKQIASLAEVCSKVEKIFKAPQEIEWAIERDKIYIVQTRSLLAKKSK